VAALEKPFLILRAPEMVIRRVKSTHGRDGGPYIGRVILLRAGIGRMLVKLRGALTLGGREMKAVRSSAISPEVKAARDGRCTEVAVKSM
jgi:hypothetical protein